MTQAQSVARAEHNGAQDQGYEQLIATLFEELNQTERSAKRHCAREAERLGRTPPAFALRAAALHAERVLPELLVLARKAGLPHGWVGRAIGEIFTNARQYAADRLMDAERSYRGTLLGLRHGVDVVAFLKLVAEASDRPELSRFCARWLEDRVPLVNSVAGAMSWFAEHPCEARARATATVAPDESEDLGSRAGAD